MKSPQLLLAASLVVSACSSENTPTSEVPSDIVGLSGPALYFSSAIGADVDDGETMRDQALGAMTRLEANINAASLSLEEVTFVRAYLAPGVDGSVDYAGWGRAWAEVFDNLQPALTTVAVPALSRPGQLIELEYVAVVDDTIEMVARSDAQDLPVANPNIKPYGTRAAESYSGIGVLSSGGLYWTAGMTAPVVNEDVPRTSDESRGDMLTQSRNVLARLRDSIAEVGLTLADVVYVRAFLGPDNEGSFDYDAWDEAYGQFFNNSNQPHKPARTTVTSPDFPGPGALIEVEFVAAFPEVPSLFEGPATSPNPNLRTFGQPTAMVSSGVAVKPGSQFYFSPGEGPTDGDDIRSQALSALESLQMNLTEIGAGFEDVIFVRAYVVPEADGSFDLAGWQEAYAAFFNTPEQPHKSARTTIEVASLPNPEWKIAIDLIAALP